MIVAGLVVLGLVLGSFVNALVWRLRQQDVLLAEPTRGKHKKLPVPSEQTDTTDYSILRGRSMCPDCHHTLAAKDLVPVLSWLWLRGKCRYCSKPISWQYPLVELLTAIMMPLSYIWLPYSLDGYGVFRLAILLVYIVIFMALSVYDWHWQELPDRLVWLLLGAAIIDAVIQAVMQHRLRVLLVALLTGCILFALFWVIYQVSRGEWIGGGDVKLVLALGIIAGTPLMGFLLIFIASLIGTLMSLPVLFKVKSTHQLHIPFGPALLLATHIVYLAGALVLSWYEGMFYV